MINSKAVQIMQSLSDEELKDFSRFVISPYFNRLKDVTRLFNILKNYHPDFNPEKIPDKEKAYKKLFPSRPYNDARMRNLISDLGQLAEKFLFLKSQEDKSIYESNTYMKYLLNRQLFGVFEGALKKSEKADSRLNVHFTKHQIADLKASFLQCAGKYNKSSEALYQKYDLLTGFYLSSMMNGFFQHEMSKNLKGLEKSPNVFKDFFSSFDFKSFREKIEANRANIPQNELDYIDIQYFFYEMLKGINIEESYNQLLGLVNKYDKTMTQPEKHEIYSNISNVLAIKVYAEGLGISNLELMLFKEIIAKQAYFGDKRRAVMPVSMYLKGVDLALNQGQAGFIDFMLESLVHITPFEIRQSLINYTKAKLEFVNKNFEASLAHLAKVEQRTAELKQHAKGLELLLHYELKRFVSGKTLAVSFRDELKKGGMFKGMYGPWYDNFLKLYGTLVEMKLQKADYTNDIKAGLNDNAKVMYKPWLLEKAG